MGTTTLHSTLEVHHHCRSDRGERTAPTSIEYFPYRYIINGPLVDTYTLVNELMQRVCIDDIGKYFVAGQLRENQNPFHMAKERKTGLNPHGWPLRWNFWNCISRLGLALFIPRPTS